MTTMKKTQRVNFTCFAPCKFDSHSQKYRELLNNRQVFTPLLDKYLITKSSSMQQSSSKTVVDNSCPINAILKGSLGLSWHQ